MLGLVEQEGIRPRVDYSRLGIWMIRECLAKLERRIEVEVVRGLIICHLLTISAGSDVATSDQQYQKYDVLQQPYVA